MNSVSADLDHVHSEEPTYQETVRGIRPCMGWNQILNFENPCSSADDNTFVGPKQQSTGKISVNLSTD